MCLVKSQIFGGGDCGQAQAQSCLKQVGGALGQWRLQWTQCWTSHQWNRGDGMGPSSLQVVFVVALYDILYNLFILM